MTNILIINEKPSVSRDYSRVLGLKISEKKQGYIEGYSDFFGCNVCITWAVGHLIAMSYPEKYSAALKKWELETLPFLPEEYKYEVIPTVQGQFDVVKKLLNSVSNTGTIYYAGDSGREGLVIQSLIRDYAGHTKGATEKVVWIDSMTETEIKRGIKDAKEFCEYQAMKESGYMRQMEDFALGINFSRALSLLYGNMINSAAGTTKYIPVAVGRVMTCVLGMVVSREREIRNFVSKKFYRIISTITVNGIDVNAEWKVAAGSKYNGSPLLYSPNGFLTLKDADAFIQDLQGKNITIDSVGQTLEKKNAPSLYNLAELQADCSKKFKISPDETLQIIQQLYEKKLTTYPRTDARVLTTAIAGEIDKNIAGLKGYTDEIERFCNQILQSKSYLTIKSNNRYTDDSKVTDHYAIIPTGQSLREVPTLSTMERNVFDLIVRRFLSIFYPSAVYKKVQITEVVDHELFYSSVKVLAEPGFLAVAGLPSEDKNKSGLMAALLTIKKGERYKGNFRKEEGTTTPPKRYDSGTLILAMENAGMLVEEDDLREQIKSCGIGTSATRAEIIKKLVTNTYLQLNRTTQIITSGQVGEMIYDLLDQTIPSLLNPKMTANWEKGLDEIVKGTVDVQEYRTKLENYIRKTICNLKENDITQQLQTTIRPYAKNKTFTSERTEVETTKYNCPSCGAPLIKSKYGFSCSAYKKSDKKSCRFLFGTICGHTATEQDLQSLVSNGITGDITDFVNPKDKCKRFSSKLFLEEKEENGMKIKTISFYKKPMEESKYRCPFCKTPLMEGEWKYSCNCGYAISKKIAGIELLEEDIESLLSDRKTRKIHGFMSKKGKPFNAVLVMDGKELKFDFS